MLKMSSGIICDDENVAVVVLNSSDLTTEHKQAYIHSLETKITSIKAIKDKIAILIDTKIIRMTTDNLSFIRNNYPDQKFHFIRINMKEYVDTVSKTLFSQNELVEILTWDINDDLKISLLKMSKEPISIIGKGLICNTPILLMWIVYFVS